MGLDFRLATRCSFVQEQTGRMHLFGIYMCVFMHTSESMWIFLLTFNSTQNKQRKISADLQSPLHPRPPHLSNTADEKVSFSFFSHAA